MPDSYFLTLANIELFEAIVGICAVLAYYALSMEKHSSDLKMMWKRAERVSSILFIEEATYVAC